MDELIQQLTSKLGIDPSVAQNATGKAMALVKEHAGDDLFAKISSAVPGASQAAEGASEASAGGEDGGMLGKLAGMASSALGGSAGGGLELGAALNSAGLDTAQIGQFVRTIVDFVKEKAGEDVVNQLLDEFPMLKTLIG
jgi:hypothetical protein